MFMTFACFSTVIAVFENLIREKLQELHCEDALEQDIAAVNNVLLLAGANTIVELNTYSNNIFGIETANPGSGYIHVIPKTYVGCQGLRRASRGANRSISSTVAGRESRRSIRPSPSASSWAE